ncbi:remorin 4.2-like [Nicotiana tabacum]|uniref:Remorin 4.2-like n=1 Tax=Nicotiana tabacum TaxID=4097 RepID=A0A1S3ZLR6_TOBAC|nr:remorin 4.2-like [Nicotiana tomentosiformis]XP_016465203.1 PREDICTED: remorin-like [Nicotiana tabacum]
MLNYQRPSAIASSSRESLLVQEHNNHDQDHQEEEQIRDIYALTPPRPPSTNRGRQRETWETNSHRSSTNLSTASTEIASSENFSTMSREFNALVLAGSSISNNHGSENDSNNNNNNNSNILGRIGEDDYETIEETNPLAIVPDNYSNPLSLDTINNPSSRDHVVSNSMSGINHGEITVQRVKKEEVESKINAWQNAKISKINNRFKREDAVIIGWESEEVQKATSWMKKVERKLEEKRAKALEKMQNDIAKARRKAEERRASAEAKRGTKVAKVLEICNLMRAVGRAPAKRSFF